MECSNGGYECQAQPRTWRVAAGIEPVKPPENLAALFNRNTEPIIGHGQRDTIFCLSD